jgi:Iron-containing redox enzyme
LRAGWRTPVGRSGRATQRPCDAALFAIYADEMGYGNLRKNHIALIHRALHSMGIRLPRIRDGLGELRLHEADTSAEPIVAAGDAEFTS